MARPAAEQFVSAKGNTVFKGYGSVYGGCLHSQVSALMGMVPSPVFASVARVFEWGHEREKVMKRDLSNAGLPMFFASDKVNEQLELSMFERYDDSGKEWLLLSLHPDGLAYCPEGIDPSTLLFEAGFQLQQGMHLWRPGSLVLLECKTAKSKEFSEEYVRVGLAKNERYQFQVDGSQHAAKDSKEVKALQRGEVEGTLFLIEERAVVEREEGGKTVKDNVAGQRLALFLDGPVHTRDECMGRLRQVVDLYKAGIIPECDSKFSCSYKLAKPKNIEDLDPEDELHRLVGEFAQARSDAAFYADLVVQARKALIDALGERTVRAAGFVADYKVNRKGVGTLTVERDQ